jgi:hypothetical protein
VRQCLRHSLRVFGVLAALTLVVGCVSNTPPKQEVRAPADLRPDLLMIAVYPLIDDDNNGYPDTIPLVVYLWDERYPLPLWADGSIHFTLTGREERVIAEWEVPADIVSSSRRRDQVGAAHHMTLDIRDATNDVRPLTNARISGVFLGTDGTRAATKRPLGIQIGG